MTDIHVDGWAGPEASGTGPDDAPFDALFAAHYRPLVRLAALLGADDPEDIAQDAFARYYRRRGRLRDGNAAFAYLRSTVYNLTRNRRRHLRVAGARLARLRDRTVPDVDPPADAAAVLREDSRELLAALDRIAPRQREVLVLRYWLELSEREIAEVMDISVGTVKSHAHRGVAALQSALEETS
ncbi:RNA polymerase sigma factor [Spirillospora sp. CA-294931]|uniref:RNA polymerase sigma factor n=1 Tax=Spirillospora sp. CA-294931 TaxID=3240042 RepID=UPI003D8C872D